MAAVFEARRQLVKGLQIGLSDLTVRHGGVNAVHAGQGENLLDQVGDGVHPGFPAQHRQIRKELNGFLVFVFQKRVIDGALGITAPEGRQLVGGEAKYGAGHGGDQGDILPGVGNGLQNGAQGLDLGSLQQVRTAAGGAADAQGLQGLPELIAHGAGRPQQDHDVLWLYRPQLVPVPDQLP